MDNDSDRDTQEQDAPPAAGSDTPRAPSDQPQEPAYDQRETKKQKRDYSHVRPFGFPLLEFLQVFFNGLLVIAGIVGAVVILRQLDIMEEQMADARKAAREQDRAAARTLAAVEKQGRLAEMQMAPVNRPWLVLEPTRVDEPFTVRDGQMYFNFRFGVRNTGKLPATKVRIFTTLIYRPQVYPPPQEERSVLGKENPAFVLDHNCRTADNLPIVANARMAYYAKEILPSKSVTFGSGNGTSEREIRENQIRYFSWRRGREAIPIITVCVSYEIPYSHHLHHLKVAYAVFHMDGGMIFGFTPRDIKKPPTFVWLSEIPAYTQSD